MCGTACCGWRASAACWCLSACRSWLAPKGTGPTSKSSTSTSRSSTCTPNRSMSGHQPSQGKAAQGVLRSKLPHQTTAAVLERTGSSHGTVSSWLAHAHPSTAERPHGSNGVQLPACSCSTRKQEAPWAVSLPENKQQAADGMVTNVLECWFVHSTSVLCSCRHSTARSAARRGDDCGGVLTQVSGPELLQCHAVSVVAA